MIDNRSAFEHWDAPMTIADHGPAIQRMQDAGPFDRRGRSLDPIAPAHLLQ
jgi:hypothetical protein